MRTRGSIEAYNQARAWIFFFGYAAMLVFLAHRAAQLSLLDESQQAATANFSKFEQVVEYFVFAIFLQRALYLSPWRRPIWCTILGTLLFLAGSEAYQYFFLHTPLHFWTLLLAPPSAILGILLYQATLPKSERDSWRITSLRSEAI